jgi:DNA-binding HxlR family transcriptional regulator
MENARHTETAIEETLRVVGDRWSILLVRAGLRGIRRFDDFCDDLGIARPVLTERLRRLVKFGIFERRKYQDKPVRYEYRLTEAGLALSPALVALVRWSEEYSQELSSDVTLVHAPCGTELEQAFWCRSCQSTFGPSAVKGLTSGIDS